MDENKKKLMLSWMRKVHILEHAHRKESIRWNKIHNWLGVFASIIAVLIGALGSIAEFKDVLFIKLLPSVGGIIVAALSGLQTFLRPAELAEKHRSLSMTYEALRHKFEFLCEFKITTPDVEKDIESLRTEWNQIDAMNVSGKHFQESSIIIDNLQKYSK